jgi:uncharacterized protein (TIGR00661 family)
MPAPAPPTVFYGICGEGLGHFARAAFLVPQLTQRGWRVEIFSSGRVAALSERRFSTCRVHRVPGLRMHYRANRLDVVRTTLNYAATGLRGARAATWVAHRARVLQPVAVITDYEPIVAWTARALRIPCVALDHQQIATECAVAPGYAGPVSMEMLRISNRMTYRRPALRIITSFFRAPLRPGPTCAVRELVGPVLRPQVLERAPSDGSHIMVYQTSSTLEWLDCILDALPGEKRVYGAGRRQSGRTEQPFSEASFLDGLASCRLAVVNGGHTAISEALFYGKPVLCFPVRGQAEQELNARQLQRCGFGMTYRPAPGTPPDFGAFFEREARIRRNIAERAAPCGNDALVQVLFRHLSRWKAACPATERCAAGRVRRPGSNRTEGDP